IKNSIFCPLTVVGDDDQSLYRFRGSTVQLFRDFRRNFQTLFNIEPKLLFLVTNYRSSESIISFYNYFLKLDPNYLKNARVNEKEFVENKDYSESPSNFPVLGMFRDDLKTLAKDLSEFINEVFHGSGRYIEDNPIKYRLKANPNGDIGDCVLLMASPREFSSWRKIRLPAYLREFFRDKGVSVFNPRGEEISSILNFQRLTGLILICIDNDRRIQKGLHLYKNLDDTFDKWRKKAEDYIENLDDKNLNNYIKSWNNRNSSKNESWEIPLLDVVYDIIHWFGEFQDNPQDQLYLELLTRTISESSTFSRYESRIVKLEEKTDLDSIKEIYWNIFVPIASGEIYLNEDLIEDFPHNQFNILSIHQSKGLEFPIVIVDVGSEFERENQKQAFKRFPNREDLGLTYILEQEFRNYTPIDGFLENREDPVERAFDDLIRKFYVGYSRAQEVLLLVGLTSNIKKKIPNIPLGWNREKEWFWENLDKILLMI
ncbi:MAG: 3'-5' exonuclease, partial [Candidatus Lokiarchaeota archaeon]